LDPPSRFARLEALGPVEFSFDGSYRGIDLPATAHEVLGSEASTIDIPLRGGSIYCYRISNRARTDAVDTLGELSNLRRRVQLSLVFSPQA
jgi:hypothetical protein